MRVHGKILLILAGLSGALSAAGQRAVPFMWIPKGIDTVQRNKFVLGGYPTASSRSKADIFNTAMGSALPPDYIYTPDAIDQLIGLVQTDNGNNSPNGIGIRLYFAAYDAANAPTDFKMGPTIRDKQLVLLFCGSTGFQSADVPTYYVISPVDMMPHKISGSIFNDWCNYYYSNEDNANGLATTLETGHPQENQYNGKDFDTRSIYYDLGNFTDFVQAERTYQDTCVSCNPTGAKIDGIGFYFAAYNNTGVGCNPYGELEALFKDRLFVVIEFMRGPNIFFIDDAPGFGSRPVNSPCQQQGFRKIMGGGNNGQLCPPNCPCQTCVSPMFIGH